MRLERRPSSMIRWPLTVALKSTMSMTPASDGVGLCDRSHDVGEALAELVGQLAHFGP